MLSLLKKKLRSTSVFVIHSQLLKANGKKKAALFHLPGSFAPLQESQEVSAPTGCFAQQELKGGLNYMCLSWGIPRVSHQFLVTFAQQHQRVSPQ